MIGKPSRPVTVAAKWHSYAACRHTPGLDFIEAAPVAAEAMACKTVCHQCPVRLTCAATALQSTELWGVWGALDAAERTRLARQPAALS